MDEIINEMNYPNRRQAQSLLVELTGNKYQIQHKLGQGGMSAVYKARSKTTGDVVALKMLQPRDEIFVELVGRNRLREIFLEEAYIMRSIRHEHIAEVLECDGGSEVPSIVLEYYPRSLGSLVKDSTRTEVTGIMSLSMVYGYICQALDGLEWLHRSGIIHRDIKPHNLMISADNTIKIIDFGLCMVDGKEKMAIPGMQVGSPYYAAPEQQSNPALADERSDLYSLGVTAYRLLTGRLANWSEPHNKVPSDFNNCLDAYWDVFLLKSIEPDASFRFQSAVEMSEYLETLSV